MIPLPKIGLYYPFIQFRSDEWVKLAALYWDAMERVVPAGYWTTSAKDSDTVHVLSREGFVVNREPDLHKHLQKVAQELTAVVEANEAQLVESYSVRSILTGPPGQLPPHVRAWTGSPDPSLVPGQDPRLSYLYVSKIEGRLMDALVGTGLGIPSGGEFIGMHPQLAYVYMQALAQVMAGEGSQPVTDDAFDHVAEGCSVEQIANALLDQPTVSTGVDPDEIDALFASIAIQAVIPRGLDNVPVAKVVEFRSRYRDQMTAFQLHIEELGSQLTKAAPTDDLKELETVLQLFNQKTLQSDLDELKGGLRTVGMDTVLGALNLKVALPPLALSTATMLHLSLATVNPLALAGGAIALVLTPHVREKQREARDLIRRSHAAYLYNIEEQLKPKGLAEKIAQQVRRLVPGLGL